MSPLQGLVQAVTGSDLRPEGDDAVVKVEVGEQHRSLGFLQGGGGVDGDGRRAAATPGGEEREQRTRGPVGRLFPGLLLAKPLDRLPDVRQIEWRMPQLAHAELHQLEEQLLGAVGMQGHNRQMRLGLEQAADRAHGALVIGQIDDHGVGRNALYLSDQLLRRRVLRQTVANAEILHGRGLFDQMAKEGILRTDSQDIQHKPLFQAHSCLFRLSAESGAGRR